MPIKQKHRDRYPEDWPVLSRRVRFERAGGICEFCRIAEHGQPHPITGSTVVLTVAHLDPNYEHVSEDDVAAMCQRCHLTYDAPLHAASRIADTAQSDLLGPRHIADILPDVIDRLARKMEDKDALPADERV